MDHIPMTKDYQIPMIHHSSRVELRTSVSASINRYDFVTMSRPIERTPWRTESVNS
jgi:hypothetical protein